MLLRITFFGKALQLCTRWACLYESLKSGSKVIESRGRVCAVRKAFFMDVWNGLQYRSFLACLHRMFNPQPLEDENFSFYCKPKLVL